MTGPPPLEPLAPLSASGLAVPGGLLAHPGLWRYAQVLPVTHDRGLAMTMGEGATPALPARELPGVTLKLEFLSPTGSFKDRGAAVLVASAAQRGALELIADSSGNAGSAIAAYATRAGLPCRVFVPEGTSMAKRAQIRAYGAELVAVAGDRAATARAAQAAVEERGAAYASHVFDAAFFHGTKTFAYELWEQLRPLPDAVVLPAGNGTLLLGAALGFAELHAAGLIARRPALIAVQSEHCRPLAVAWEAGGDPRPATPEPTLAEGIAIADPARGAEMLGAVRDSGGEVLAVPETAIRPAQADLAARGLLVEPTAAVPWAAVLLARAPQRLGMEAVSLPAAGAWRRARALMGNAVAVPLCGSGLKSGLDWAL